MSGRHVKLRDILRQNPEELNLTMIAETNGESLDEAAPRNSSMLDVPRP